MKPYTTIETIDVLDHGYIRFIESWGRGDADEAEAGIIEAARQSTQGSFRGWQTDEAVGDILSQEFPRTYDLFSKQT